MFQTEIVHILFVYLFFAWQLLNLFQPNLAQRTFK